MGSKTWQMKESTVPFILLSRKWAREINEQKKQFRHKMNKKAIQAIQAQYAVLPHYKKKFPWPFQLFLITG